MFKPIFAVLIGMTLAMTSYARGGATNLEQALEQTGLNDYAYKLRVEKILQDRLKPAEQCRKILEVDGEIAERIKTFRGQLNFPHWKHTLPFSMLEIFNTKVRESEEYFDTHRKRCRR